MTWEEALAYATVLEAAGGWNGDAPKASAPTPPVEPSGPRADASAPVAPVCVAIADALDLYKTMKRATVAPSTFRKHRTFTKQLAAFATARGFVWLDEFTRLSIDVYYATSTLSPRSKAKMLEALRGFFRFCVNREWLTKSPVSPDLKPPRGSSRPVNKMPFTDEQLADIIEACDQLEGRRWGNRYGAGEWTGEDVKEFIWVMPLRAGSIASPAPSGVLTPPSLSVTEDSRKDGSRHLRFTIGSVRGALEIVLAIETDGQILGGIVDGLKLEPGARDAAAGDRHRLVVRYLGPPAGGVACDVIVRGERRVRVTLADRTYDLPPPPSDPNNIRSRPPDMMPAGDASVVLR